MTGNIEVSKVIHLQAIGAEAEIYEVALYTPVSKGATPDFQRISMLSASLQLTKTWFEEMDAQPVTDFGMFGFPQQSHLSYFTITLYRLATLEDPYWDRRLVKQTVDILQVLDRLGDKFSQVPIASGFKLDRQEGDVFSRAGRAIKQMKLSWEPIINQALGGGNNLGTDVLDASFWENLSFDIAGGMNGWFSDMLSSESDVSLSTI
jgi:hypothetical protein